MNFQAEVPELTLCRNGGGYKLEVLQENGIETVADYSGQLKNKHRLTFLKQNISRQEKPQLGFFELFGFPTGRFSAFWVSQY